MLRGEDASAWSTQMSGGVRSGQAIPGSGSQGTQCGGPGTGVGAGGDGVGVGGDGAGEEEAPVTACLKACA
jgi:hypothetical protein